MKIDADVMRKAIVREMQDDYRTFLPYPKLFKTSEWVTTDRKDTGGYIIQRFQSRSSDIVAIVYFRKDQEYITQVEFEFPEEEAFAQDLPADGNPWTLTEKEMAEKRDGFWKRAPVSINEEYFTENPFFPVSCFKVVDDSIKPVSEPVQDSFRIAVFGKTEEGSKILISSVAVNPGAVIDSIDGELTIFGKGVTIKTNCTPYISKTESELNTMTDAERELEKLSEQALESFKKSLGIRDIYVYTDTE